MQHTFKTLLFAAIFAFCGSTASEAEEKGSAAPEIDVDKLCFSVAEACLDACGKAAMPDTELSKCNQTCGNSMQTCLGQTASQGGAATSANQGDAATSANQGDAATSKDQIRPKRKTKKYVPSN